MERGNPGYPRKGDVAHAHASSPCVAFSGANRVEGGGKNGLWNNELIFAWVHVIRLMEPYTASFENVTGLLTKEHLVYLQTVVAKALFELHYTSRICVLNASKYGDPQERWRVIIFASREGVPLPNYPTPTHGGPGLPQVQTVGDALQDLEDVAPESGCGLVQLPDGTIVRNHSM